MLDRADSRPAHRPQRTVTSRASRMARHPADRRRDPRTARRVRPHCSTTSSSSKDPECGPELRLQPSWCSAARTSQSWQGASSASRTRSSGSRCRRPDRRRRRDPGRRAVRRAWFWMAFNVGIDVRASDSSSGLISQSIFASARCARGAWSSGRSTIPMFWTRHRRSTCADGTRRPARCSASARASTPWIVLITVARLPHHRR